MGLRTFFRALPAEVLEVYRRRVLPPSAPVAADVDAVAEQLAARFLDRAWVHEQLAAMDKSHHVALVALLQCQGVAGGTWLLQELTQSHGMSEDLWAEVMHRLDLWVFGNSHQSPPLFYIIPEALQAPLEAAFRKRLGLSPAKEDEHNEVRASAATAYSHPFGFSLVTLLTWLRQEGVKLTRKDEIFKKQLDETLAFFRDLWGDGTQEKVLLWYLDLLQSVGMVHQRGGYLVVDDVATEEFLALRPDERREVVRRWLHDKEPLLSWTLNLLEAVPAGQWVPMARVKTAYRRRYMGQVFHRRYVKKTYYLPPSGFYDANPPVELLQIGGLIDSGLGPSGGYLRLSDSGRDFVTGGPWEAREVSDQVRFVAQPTFEVLAPVGLPLERLWRLGQVARLQRADRASTYVVTAESVRSALDDGLRPEGIEQLLGDGAIRLPQNVLASVRGWIGNYGEVELHDALVLRVNLDRVAVVSAALQSLAVRFERLAETVFVLPRERIDDVVAVLREGRVDVAARIRRHDDADAPATRRGPLRALLARSLDDESAEDTIFPPRSLVMLTAPTAEGGREVMAARGVRTGRTGANAVGADLSVKPAAAGAGDLLKLSPGKTLSLVKAALRMKQDLDVLYPSTGEGDPGGLARVTPLEVKEESAASWFMARHHRLGRDVQLHIKRIQGIRLAT